MKNEKCEMENGKSFLLLQNVEGYSTQTGMSVLLYRNHLCRHCNGFLIDLVITKNFHFPAE